MSTISDYLQPAMLLHALGNTTYSAATNLTVKLYTAPPTGAGGGTEVTGGSYAGVVLTNNVTNFPQCATSGVVTKTNGSVIQFPTATAAWGTVTHWGITDGTNLLVWGPMTPNTYVASGDTPKIAIGALTITFTNTSAGGFTEAIRRKLLDLVFGKVTYVKPTTVYLGALTAISGETITEWSDGNYSRNTASFTTATGGSVPNAAGVAITNGSGTGSAGATLNGFGIWDDATSGNLLVCGPLTTSRTPSVSDQVQFSTGAVIVTIQ